MSAPIVCGIDRSEDARAAARLASALARRLGVRLRLIHVARPDARPDVGVITFIEGTVREEARDVDVEVLLESGDIPERLTDAARDAALLVVGTRGEGVLRQTLHGSVSAAVARDPRKPVVVVPPGALPDEQEPLKASSVVCGVCDERDEEAAQSAARMAADLGLDLTLAHVLQPLTIAPIPPAGPPPGDMMPSTTERVKAAREILDHVARSIADSAPATPGLRIVEGLPGPELAQLARDEDAAFCVVSASGRGPLAGAISEDVPRHLMREGTRPVMVCPRSETEGR